jgi:glycosyltransferase involved in cell wall biosynthesis
VNVSVLLLTLNEEINVEACLQSLSWSDDIVVLDSMSKDSTTQIAAKLGARIVQRPFDNWSAHQNWAVSQIEFRNPWVFYMDADERCTMALRDEIVARVLPDSTESAFRIRRRDFYMGRWLKRAQLYPTWLVRLFRPHKIRYERLVNPVAIVDGPIGDLQNDIHHFPFSHGVAHWIGRHNNYSDLEAHELLKVREGSAVSESRMFSNDPNERRRALKDLFFRMPARPAVKFAYYYLWRRGFLDGRAGLTYSTLQAIYEFMIDCKYRELIRQKQGLPL